VNACPRLIVSAVVLSLAPVISLDALAKIRCQGPYQIVDANTVLPTPYCEDEYLAVIGRSFGLKYSGAQIRADQSIKRRVCQVLRTDHRAASICIGTVIEPLF
jgi:hypothetical protein